MLESPQGFVDVVETDAARPDEAVEAMLSRGEGWGVFDGERLLGKLTIDRVFERGLHEFLTEFTRCNAAIARAIADDYRFQR